MVCWMMTRVLLRIGDVTQELKSSGQWDNTLMVVHADNGGPIYYSGCCGGNNYPLKGGKLSNWEGGIRSNAFVSGGFLPASVRFNTSKVAIFRTSRAAVGEGGVTPVDNLTIDKCARQTQQPNRPLFP